MSTAGFSRDNGVPLVSVVIPTFNRQQYVVDAIDSALHQTYPAVEVIVVDDGSTDDTRAVLGGYGDSVRYIRQRHAGPSAARNTGMKLATGAFIALLDSDDVWAPHKLERQLPCFQYDSCIGLIHAGKRRYDVRRGEDRGGMLPKTWLDVHEVLVNCDIVCSTAVLPRRVLEEVGDFDESLLYCEDWDFWIRVAAQYRVYGCQEVLVESRKGHGTNQTLNQKGQTEAGFALMRKHRNLHPRCPLCDSAMSAALSKIRTRYYEHLRVKAHAALRSKNYLRGTLLQLRALQAMLLR